MAGPREDSLEGHVHQLLKMVKDRKYLRGRRHLFIRMAEDALRAGKELRAIEREKEAAGRAALTAARQGREE